MITARAAPRAAVDPARGIPIVGITGVGASPVLLYTSRVISRSSPATVPSRWDAVDVARGIAIAAMIAYHFFWDLSFLQLTSIKVTGEPVWNVFARSIAGSFLALAGFGLALAHAEGFRRRAFLIRLAKVAGAALAVTLATLLAFPESYIFFGILHAIAVGSVLALPFLRAPLWLVLATAAVCFAAPHVLKSPAFDHPLLDWLGLGSRDPLTNDYVPVFPWFGPVLIGLALGRTALRRGETPAVARWRAANPAARVLAWAGRRSLPIYLVHQPILLGMLTAVLQFTGPNPQALSRAFVAQCTTDCIRSNDNPALCRTACACIAERLRDNDSFDSLRATSPTPADRTRISEAAQACLREAPP